MSEQRPRGQPLRNWFKRNSLWIVGFGLMLASSGLDGVYMMLWMPTGAGILGLVLNTVADIANMKLGTEFGKLQRSTIKERRKLSVLLLFGELIAIAYSWFFSWRQMRRVLPAIEPDDWTWVSFVAAGFIPVTLFFLGIAQSLQVASRDLLQGEEEKPGKAEPEPLKCPTCGATHGLSGQPFLTQAQLKGHMRAHASGNGNEPQPERVEAGEEQS